MSARYVVGPLPLPRVSERTKFTCPADFVAFCQREPDNMTKYEREVFRVFYLDSRTRLVGLENIAVGAVDQCPVAPLEVFRPALLLRAATMVFVHNHPSGDPEPSASDISLTKNFERAALTLGLRVLDHLIVGHLGSVSFAGRGLIGGTLA